MTMRRLALGVTVMLGMGSFSGWAQVGPDSPGWFPFVMRGTDVAEDSPVDVSFLNDKGARRRISVRDGQFVDETGERVRFFGTNVTFSGAFPEKSASPAIAARLAQLGMNVVRFHHMDARDIWQAGGTEIDPAKLDQLHWFIFQLKEHGIYSNINLHVSRTYPGLRELNLARTFRYGKVLDIFHDPYIALQEAYARDLLQPVNPYTTMPLATDPAVAFVELNNENTLLHLGPAQMAELTAPKLRESLRKPWTEWLSRHYAAVPAAEDAWNRGVVPLGEEMLTNPGFAGDLQPWVLEGAEAGVCEMSRSADGGGSMQITIREPGEVAWAYQLHQLDLALEEDMTYTVRFRAKADPPRSVSVSLRFAEAPWTILTGRRVVQLTDQWQEFIIPCQVKGLDGEPRLRLSFNLGDSVGNVWLADASLRPGRKLYRAEGLTSLEAMPLPSATAPPLAWRDFRQFLIETERAYVTRLREFLKDEVGVRSLIINTQASYGGYWGLWREASLSDYIDMHSYWQHPRFPGRPWDGSDWFIPNTSMATHEHGGVFSRLSAYRDPSLPFSVSEYNHPAPNDHAAEMFPMLATFGCYQDWDALYQFGYANRAETYDAEKIGGYFELCHHAAQLVFAPLMAVMFRQDLLPPAEERITVTVPLEQLVDTLDAGFASDGAILPDSLSVRERFAGRFGVRIDPQAEGPVQVPDDVPPAPAGEGVLVDSPQLHWTTGEDALFQAVAPAARVAVGRLGGKTLTLGNTTVIVNLDDGAWACLALVAADGQPVENSARLLLAVTTRVENTGMGWNEERTTVGRDWGSAPVLAQGVPFVLEGPGEPPRAFALDSLGQRRAPVSVSAVEGGWSMTGGPEHRTLWYVLER